MMPDSGSYAPAFQAEAPPMPSSQDGGLFQVSQAGSSGLVGTMLNVQRISPSSALSAWIVPGAPPKSAPEGAVTTLPSAQMGLVVKPTLSASSVTWTFQISSPVAASSATVAP